MAKAFGNLMNRVMEDVKSAVPQIGDGATELCYSDRHAYTIVEVAKDGKSFIMQQDNAIRTDNNGMSDSQQYAYSANLEGCKREVKLCKDRRWRVNDSVWRNDKNHPDGGKWGKSTKNGRTVLVGVRDEHYDYTF